MAEDRVRGDVINKIAEKVIRGVSDASTDREAVIVSAAFLSDLLRSRLENYLVENEAIQSSMFDPLQNGALSNFVPMANMAYLLGMMPIEVLRWLKLMAKLRNTFAHSWLITSFEEMSNADDKSIRQTINKLEEFTPPVAREGVHPLRGAYDFLLMSIMFGLDPMMKANVGGIQHLSEMKFPFEVAEGDKDWQALFNNYVSGNPAFMQQVMDQVKMSEIPQTPDVE